MQSKKGVGESKATNRLRNGIIGIGVVGLTSFGGYGLYQQTLGADATELEVTTVELVDGESVEVTTKVPVLQYLVVGGEPRDIEYDSSDTRDKINYYVNNGETDAEAEEELEVKGVKDVSNERLDVEYEEISKDIKVNSVVDYGNIGVFGDNFSQTSKELINLAVEGAVTEHLAKFDDSTGKYTLVEERKGDISAKDIKDNNYALITFIDKFEPVEEVKEEETETEVTESETETESEVKEDTNSTEPVEEETETEVEEPEVEEPEVETEEDSVEEDLEVDVSKKGGTGTLLGSTITVGESENNPNENGLTLFVTYEQLEYLQEFTKSKLADHKFYKDNNITTAQGLYDKFGLYNISKDIEWLYVSELDTDKDGILGTVEGSKVVNWVEVEVPEGFGNQTGGGSLGEGEKTIEEIKEEEGEYVNDVIDSDDTGNIVGDEGSEEVYNPDGIEDTGEVEETEGNEVEIGEISDIDYGIIEGGDLPIVGDDAEVITGSNGTEGSSSTTPIGDIDINLGEATTSDNLDIRFDENGRISEVYNEAGDRIAYRDAEGNLIYDLSLTHPDRVSFENKLNRGELEVRDSSGNTAKVSTTGEILPDTGMEGTNKYMIPVAVSALVLGLGLIVFARIRGRKEDKDVEQK